MGRAKGSGTGFGEEEPVPHCAREGLASPSALGEALPYERSVMRSGEKEIFPRKGGECSSQST